MASDNVELLSYTTNLLAGAYYQSDPQILGQYISLSIIASADQDLTISIQFSGNGIDYDYTVSKNITVGSNTSFSNPVNGKWTRIRITNNGILDTTHLRVFVYGTPNNSSLSAVISKIGNFDPTIHVSNLPLSSFGDIRTAQITNRVGYVFSRGTQGVVNTGAYKIPYTDIEGSSNVVGSTWNYTGGLGGILGPIVGETVMFQGIRVRYEPGQGLVARFTGLFQQSTKTAPDLAPMTQYLGVGNGVISTRTVTNFLGFGYINQGLASNTDNFGIIYIRNGVRAFYPHTSWNIDKADGTYQLPAIDLTKIQVYQINVQYLGAGAITFYMENSSTGLFLPVHQLTFNTGTTTSLTFSELGFIMYSKPEAGCVPTFNTDYIGCGSFAIGIDGPIIDPIDRYCVSSSKSILAATNTHVFSVRCDSTWFSVDNHIPLIIDTLSFSCSGAKPVSFFIYRNATITTPTFVANYPTLVPMSSDTVGTFSAIGSGQIVYASNVGKDGNADISLMKYNLMAQPGDVFSVVAYSAQASDVVCSLVVHM